MPGLTKFIDGSAYLSSGYTLNSGGGVNSGSYFTADVLDTGMIGGNGLTFGTLTSSPPNYSLFNFGTIAATAPGYNGVSSSAYVSVYNGSIDNGAFGTITGAQGAAGPNFAALSNAPDYYIMENPGIVGPGGRGGAGIALPQGGHVENKGIVAGGYGGKPGYILDEFGAAYNFFIGYPAGPGGAGIVLSKPGTVVNYGTVTGGAGHENDASNSYLGGNGTGGDGGAGVGLAAGGYAGNLSGGTVTGGAGGHGGLSYYFTGGAGGAGGAAISLGGAGSIVNISTLAGGAGGDGAANAYAYGHSSGARGGAGGVGGAGVVLSQGGTLDNIRGWIGGGTGGVGAGGGTGPGAGGAGGAGIVLSQGGTVTNTGSVTGGAGAPAYVVAKYHANNPGTAGDGIILSDGGTVINSTAGGTDGLIRGEIGIAASGATGATVVNYGAIDGATDAVLFGTADDRLVVFAGAVFSGTIDGGGGANVLELASSASKGTITGLGSTYVNFQTVTVDAGATWNFDNTDTVDSGVVLQNAGTLNALDNHFIYLAGGTLSNQSTGLITGHGVYALPGSTGSIDNAGEIDSSYGVSLGGGGTVTNEGSIHWTSATGPAYGVYAKHGGTVINGTNADTSAAIAGYTAIRFAPGADSSFDGFVTNYGTIVGEGTIYAGISVGQGGTVSNGAAADTLALVQGGRWAVYLAAGSVTNYGTVSATYDSNAAAGVYIGAQAATIANLGSNALIEGYYGAVISYGTIINGGTIASTQGAAGIAARFIAGPNRLVVMPGADFIGTVEVENPLNSGVIELAGTAAGTFTGLGVGFTNFSIVDVDTGSNWTLTGANTAVSGGAFDVAGLLTIANSIDNDAGFTLDGGTISLASPSYVSNGSSFTFAATGSDLILAGAGGGASIVNTINGLAGVDTIDLPALTYQSGASAIVSGTTLAVVSGGATVDLTVAGLTDGMSFFTTEDGGTGTEVIACFAAGTRIATPAGEVPVEQLRIGDPVLTHGGAVAAVKWIGRRSYSAARVAGDPQLRPVRVHAGALAAGVPARDLLLSPSHALLLDGSLIPAAALVNGRSITRAPCGGVAYFHIELHSHAILLAEGAPAESFVPLAGRAMFENADEFAALYGTGTGAAFSCRPRLEDGPVLEAIRHRLAARAGLSAKASSLGPMRGHVERVVPTIDGLRIEGWLLDERAPEQPVELEVSAEGATPVRLLANRYRSDLDRAGLAGGRCGFLLRLPARGPVTVRRASDGARLAGAA